MDIFRSKEVYRKVRKRDDVNTQDPIIPVRGMYVVGQYLIPEYKGSGIEITGIRTTRPNIVTFTETTETLRAGDSIVSIVGMMLSDTPEITRYSTHKEIISPNDSVVATIGMCLSGLDLMRYSRNKESITDSVVSTVSTYLSDDFKRQLYYRIPVNNQPESCVTIRNIRTNKCVIEDMS